MSMTLRSYNGGKCLSDVGFAVAYHVLNATETSHNTRADPGDRFICGINEINRLRKLRSSCI